MGRGVVTKAVNLARGLSSSGLAYPAERALSAAERTPAQALAALGFPPDAIESHSRDYDRVAPSLFAQLIDRAAQVGAAAPQAKLGNPALPAHEAKRLLYLLVRLLQPEAVVETGTYNGTFATFLLQALLDNDRGRLVSLDLPAREAIPHAIAEPLPAGSEPGWIIPDELRSRFELVLGDARETLPPTLARIGPIGLFLHDSLHTTRHMLFEYRAAWPRLTPGGVLVTDDAAMTPAFWWFAQRRRLPVFSVGALGLTRKPR